MLILARHVDVVAVLHDKHSARVVRADGNGHHLDPVGFTRTINPGAVRNAERAAIRMRRRAIKNHVRPIALARGDEITGPRRGVRRRIDGEALDIGGQAMRAVGIGRFRVLLRSDRGDEFLGIRGIVGLRTEPPDTYAFLADVQHAVGVVGHAALGLRLGVDRTNSFAS